ncbi:MAG: VOC family protein [Burkholderiaceae bacterium]|jgi:catechol 2,3-dioxygenase-like lactoylglutathione lyase family enzyme
MKKETFTPIPLRQSVVNVAEKIGVATVRGLHHFAYRCKNTEETRHFYEDILGLPLACVVQHDKVPSSGEEAPYYHIFFEMADGSYLAFFDLLDDQPCIPDPLTPAWVNHLALEVATVEDLLTAKGQLERNGVDVTEVIDHKWFVSIYFFDPNGIRLELVVRNASIDEMVAKAKVAHSKIAGRDAKAASLRTAA